MVDLDLKELETSKVVLVVVPSTSMQKVNLRILKYFLNTKNASCVYVTVAKPYKTMINILTKNKIKTSKIFFIDCITIRSEAEEMQRAGNTVFCHPQALTNVSIALTTAIKSLPKDTDRVLVLDTMSTLMLYNEAGTVGKFVHSLTGKVRAWGVKSVIFTLEEETDKKVISQITQFCDKCIEVK